MFTPSRRSLLKNVGLATALSCQGVSILAQTSDADREKSPFRSVNVPMDGKSVAIFFDFSCQFCAKYHPTLVRWTATVPRTIRVSHYPVVNIEDAASLSEQLVAAKCFYAASSLATASQLHTFTSFVYEARQSYVNAMADPSMSGRGSATSPLGSPKMWLAAAKASGINEAAFRRLVTSDSTLRMAKLGAMKLVEYRVIDTPSVGIGGRYMLSPNNANGNEEMFFNLLNGLVSEII